MYQQSEVNQDLTDLTNLIGAFESPGFDPTEAQRIWRQRLDQESVIHWLMGGYLYEFCFRPGLYEEAKECYQKAIEANSKHKLYEYVKKQHCKNLYANEYSEIVVLFEHAIKFEKNMEDHSETLSKVLTLPTSKAIEAELSTATVINLFKELNKWDIFKFIYFLHEWGKSHSSSLAINRNYWFMGGYLYSKIEFNSHRSIALYYYRRGANLKDSKAMVNLALLFLRGDYRYVPMRYTKAISHLSEAISLNDAEAMFYRACMHLKGKGEQVNESEGYRLLDEAAKISDDNLKAKIAAYYKRKSHYDKAIQLYKQLGDDASLFERLELHQNNLGKSLSNHEAAELITKLSRTPPSYQVVRVAKEQLPDYYQLRIALAISEPSFFW